VGKARHPRLLRVTLFHHAKHGGCTLGGLGPCIGRCGILLRDRRGGSLHLRVSAGALAALANGRIRNCCASTAARIAACSLSLLSCSCASRKNASTRAANEGRASAGRGNPPFAVHQS